MSAVDIVLIGRNEAARLPAALDAALAAAWGVGGQVVFVDSGSTDASREIAAAAGVAVVALDAARPFTAARARNAGAAALGSPAPYLQFVDADCVLQPGWIATARAFLEAHPGHALVTGWAAEETPEASIYNRLIDWEWRAPVGPIGSATGNLMVRRSAFDAVSGFDAALIASEEEELCARLTAAGWALERLPEEMVRHDAGMRRLGQWWRRTERAGHGLAQLAARHPGRRRAERARAWLYGAAVPLAALGFGAFAPGLAALPLLAYPWSACRGYRRLRAEGVPAADARAFAALFTLAKFATLTGMLRHALRRLRGREMRLIEYRRQAE